jgi:protein-S-isoprenylcysteine O-methyltransferase Ste14
MGFHSADSIGGCLDPAKIARALLISRHHHASVPRIGWLACVVYSTIPSYWLMIHPFVERWRARRRCPFIVLLPAWVAMWVLVALATSHWRSIQIYHANWPWGAAAWLFACGLYIYSRSGKNFSAKQLGGLPELHFANRDQRLVADGIRARVRHPVYMAHLCKMLAWSVGTGLAACWVLTVFAVVTGVVMVRMEDAELEKRFGQEYRDYEGNVPSIPKLHS